jgi:pyrroloquinoline quinone biosynthesis protein B
MQRGRGWMGPCLGMAALLAAPGPPRSGGAPAKPPYLIVLGIAQDGGFPQAGCRRECCRRAWQDRSRRRSVASLALVDPESSERWLFDATPDFREQIHRLDAAAPHGAPALAGIALTHGHIGHYTGLMQLGREVQDARGIPVYAMPRMAEFLRTSGPWSQLVSLGNIVLRPLEDGQEIALNARLRITAFRVPHRDEYTETVGFRIRGPRRTVIFVPDIDRWEKSSVPLKEILAGSDAAYLDGTFFAADELPGRDMTQVPHPPIVETLKILAPLPLSERSKVRFIHLNHTNPALDPGSAAARRIAQAGCRVADEGERLEL